jgi:hypothetical protein
MAGRSKARTLDVPVPREELTRVVREALAAIPGLKRTQLKKALPKSFQRVHERALSALRDLATRGEIHRWSKGSVERFYQRDPIATLEEVVPRELALGPLDARVLKNRVEAVATGHGDLLNEWLKSALARGVVFMHAPTSPRSKEKRYGREPDMRLLLKAPLVALRKTLVDLDARGISRSRVAAVLLEELGVSTAAPSPASNGTTSQGAKRELLDALAKLAAENPAGALLSVRELRRRISLGKSQFDTTALLLSKEGAVSLHYHDHPASLPENERKELVQDGRGGHYVGIALRRGP